jgi:GT2 family glycosyltransferase
MIRHRLGASWRALRARVRVPAAPEAAVMRGADIDEPPTPPRSDGIDIVICVHDALEQTRQCLASVIEATTEPYRLIIVDDGSAAPTHSFLNTFVAGHDARLIRHDEAEGYTRAANAGLRASSAPWVILLNSDTVVTAGWVNRMWAHGYRDPTVGLIGPVSNCAAWQSVPYLNAGGEWLSSRLPDGLSVEEMACIVAGFRHASIPLPFLNGFCYMIRRIVIEKIGLLDDERFGPGYGEEHDYSIRAAKAGWSSVVAADTYVFHAGSRSYGAAARRSLVRRGERALRAKHDADRDIDRQVERCRTSLALAGVRGRLQSALERRRLIHLGKAKWQGRRVAFVLTGQTVGGAARAVVQEARALEAMGVDVTLLSLIPRDALSGDGGLSMRTLVFEDQSAVNAHVRAERYEALVGTSFSPPFRLPDQGDLPQTVVAYHVHRVETWFPALDDEAFPSDFRTYAEAGGFTLLARTRALADEVRIYTGRTPIVVPPSVDLDRFYPRDRQARQSSRADGRTVISAMLRPDAPWRAPRETVAALAQVVGRLRARVAVNLFGAEGPALTRAGLGAPWARHLGVLRLAEVAGLLNDSDIVVDLSTMLAFGLTPLEAMACGCGVVISHLAGASGCAHHLSNALIVDGGDAAQAACAIERLVQDPETRARLQRAAIDQAFRHTPEAAAAAIMDALLP